jgi:hypothetical protein
MCRPTRHSPPPSWGRGRGRGGARPPEYEPQPTTDDESRPTMSKLFISHSSQDDAFVRELRAALADHGQARLDRFARAARRRSAVAGDKKAIDDASAYAVVISTDALQSKWVGKELRHALKLRERARHERGKDKFPVIPLSLNGTKLGVLETFFDEEPSTSPSAATAAAACRGRDERDPRRPGPAPRRRRAHAATQGRAAGGTRPRTHRPEVQRRKTVPAAPPPVPGWSMSPPRRASARSAARRAGAWSRRLGPIEAEELRWYLEKYAVWPSHYFQDRARRRSRRISPSGASSCTRPRFPSAHSAKRSCRPGRRSAPAGRRFSVHVDVALEAGAPDAEWPMLRRKPRRPARPAVGTAPRRQRLPLPRRQAHPRPPPAAGIPEALGVPVVATPIRILLVTARPEDDACGYIDHRASALPLVDAMEALPGLVKIHVLSPPTLPALRAELDRARMAREALPRRPLRWPRRLRPTVGLGGLCFERPEDTGKLDERRHAPCSPTSWARCCATTAFRSSSSKPARPRRPDRRPSRVASELLKVGVASVVAMSHSVLVETARRFVAAVLPGAGRRQARGRRHARRPAPAQGRHLPRRIFGAASCGWRTGSCPCCSRKGTTPSSSGPRPPSRPWPISRARSPPVSVRCRPKPETGFVGRSRELLALQRLLGPDGGARYAVLRGQGGEGKTALAAEFARWLVRSQQMRRAAFVCGGRAWPSRRARCSMPARRATGRRRYSPPGPSATWKSHPAGR